MRQFFVILLILPFYLSSGPSYEIQFEEGLFTYTTSDSLVACKRGAEKAHQKRFHSTTKFAGNYELYELNQLGEGAEESPDAIERVIAEENDPLLLSEEDEVILPVFHTSDDGVPFIPTGYAYLAFKDEASDEECSEIIEENNIEITEVITGKSFFVKFPFKANTVGLANTIARRYEHFIIHAVPEFSTNFKTSFLPDSARFNNQWHLKNTGQHRGTSIGLKAGADARVVKAWEFLNSIGKNPFGKDQIKIAIIDDGFDITHPSLSHKIVDPFNAAIGAGGDVSPSHKEWHGTAVAGVAAASTV